MPTPLSSLSGKYLKAIFLFFITICSCMAGLSGCKKTDSGPGDHYTTKISGEWIGTGGGCSMNHGCGDAFVSFNIKVLNENMIIALSGDTLFYKSRDTKTQTVLFHGEYSSDKYDRVENIVYNYVNNSIVAIYTTNGAYSYGYFGEDLRIEAKRFEANSLTNDHISEIAGDKVLSGFVYDTNLMRYPKDTMFAFTDTVSFSIADNSTIICSRLAWDNPYDQLHFRSVDEKAKTITFQSYHHGNGNIYTLTYNYVDKGMVYEERYPLAGSPISRYMKLHN